MRLTGVQTHRLKVSLSLVPSYGECLRLLSVFSSFVRRMPAVFSVVPWASNFSCTLPSMNETVIHCLEKHTSSACYSRSVLRQELSEENQQFFTLLFVAALTYVDLVIALVQINFWVQQLVMFLGTTIYKAKLTSGPLIEFLLPRRP